MRSQACAEKRVVQAACVRRIEIGTRGAWGTLFEVQAPTGEMLRFVCKLFPFEHGLRVAPTFQKAVPWV